MKLTRTNAAAAVVAGLALVVTGCGDADETGAGTTPAETVTETVTEPAQGDTASASPTSSPDDTQGPGAAGLPPRPRRGTCVHVDAPDDGRYTVYDAGTAVVRHDGQRLALGEVDAAQGWTSRVDHRERREVEIKFRSDAGDRLDLEVEIDDGRIKAEICADDD